MRKLNLLLIMCLFVQFLFAQNSVVMSDKELADYIKTERTKGVSDNNIVAGLVKRGVSIEQINKIRAAANKDDNMLQNSNIDDSERIRETDGEEYLVVEETTNSEKNYIFGHNIFKEKSLNFEPNLNISTPVNYKLGPGDEVIIDIWGATQSTAKGVISPDGYINVENIGLVYLNGMTVKEADAYLKEQFSQIYAGITGDKPNTNIKLTLGQIRTIQVRVMGEVENPGTYSMSAFASVFHALYQAGGVNEIGTMRAIKVFRGNKKVVTLDVYDYLLNGKTGDDVRLEDGDVITVDTYSCLVRVEGKVKRPMFYEMKSTETVADLLRYSGGFARDAYRGDIRIERMGERERKIFTLNDSEQQNFTLCDGDIMSVDAIRDTYENMVEVKGALYRPGKFQYGEEISTVKQLVEKAGGLHPDAFTGRALLNRRLPDMTMENLSIDIEGIMNGTLPDVELRPNDVLYVRSISDVKEVKTVKIHGEVAFPGEYRYAENTTVKDLILLAGGLKEAASTIKIDIARRIKEPNALEMGDTISNIFTYSISDGLSIPNDSAFVLHPFDEVYIRRSPKYIEQQNVSVLGAVNFAGPYVLNTTNMRVSDIVKKAGIKDIAYIKGASIERKMTSKQMSRMREALDLLSNKVDSVNVEDVELSPVMKMGLDLESALANPGSDADIILEDGDKIVIPKYTNTVNIVGNVMYPNAVAYKKGAKLKHYIEQAGGYGMNAKKSKAIVVYMNGTVALAKKNKKDLIQPGCMILVPSKVERKGMSTSEILSLSSTSASMATVVLALINLLK